MSLHWLWLESDFLIVNVAKEEKELMTVSFSTEQIVSMVPCLFSNFSSLRKFVEIQKIPETE